MSKDLLVLTPNGRRQIVHCTPDTSILQVLEDVCRKHGFQASEFDLKHHNKILDLTNTIRFSNLPNKALLEMVEAGNQRKESIVTVGLLLGDGERRTAEFDPNTSLYELITSLAPTEFQALQHPTIMYMRQEVTGAIALKEKTLKQLGLIGGRAILRLLNKAEEPGQANVSKVYRKSQPVKQNLETSDDSNLINPANNLEIISKPGQSKDPLDPIQFIKKNKETINNLQNNSNKKVAVSRDENMHESSTMEMEDVETVSKNCTDSATAQEWKKEDLERRLRIEEEVTFLGAQKAIIFMQPEESEMELGDLPDDFYDLTIEEVRKLYSELQQHRLELENTPLVTTTLREELQIQTSKEKLNVYKSAVVRIQFPDRFILQGVFSPTNTIGDVINFVKDHLQKPEQPFNLFTTPIKETLDPNMTLIDAKFVPCVHMHFKWTEEDLGPPYLKEETYLKQTSSDAAGILASKYRSPNRRQIQNGDNAPSTSKAKTSTVPKWFKT